MIKIYEKLQTGKGMMVAPTYDPPLCMHCLRIVQVYRIWPCSKQHTCTNNITSYNLYESLVRQYQLMYQIAWRKKLKGVITQKGLIMQSEKAFLRLSDIKKALYKTPFNFFSLRNLMLIGFRNILVLYTFPNFKYYIVSFSEN